MNMKRILITGCGGYAAIGFIRCLRKANEKFYLIGTDSNSSNIFFKLADRSYLVPLADDPHYIEAINKVIKKEKIDFVWSQPPQEVRVISENRDKLLAKVFLPDKETINIYESKIETARRLQEKGVGTPKSLLVRRQKDLKDAFKLFGGKVWLRATIGAGGKGAFLASSLKEALFWMEFNKGWGNFSAAEYLPGKGFGCDMLFYDGKLVFSQVKERVSYFMSKVNIVGVTGTTGVLKTVNDKKINEFCEKAVRAIDQNPHGVFDVDIKCNSKGELKVTEINIGRFLSSSLSLFYKTGFLAPYYVVKLAFEGNLPLKIRKINPIRKDIIIARQLDLEPEMYSLEELIKIEKNRQKNLIALVK